MEKEKRKIMYQYKAKLIKVVDGDTVDALIDCGFSTFKKERIRLYGINSPESRTRDKAEKKRGLAAKARLKELIKEGKNQFIVETSIDKKGKFGRLLGTLYRDLENWDSYNQILVNEGHAVEYFGGKK
tara:strand:- start:224 stop:607 length:384 start_codon:yes stop_codon:yes gene_type:complete